MKGFNQLPFATIFAALLFLIVGCDQTAGDQTSDVKADSGQSMTTKADPAKLKEEIQAVETAFANADNSRDVKAISAFYADDAVTLVNNQPMIVGRAAIEKDVEAYIAKRDNGVTVAYDVLDAFGCDDYITEVGKITRKDSTGKTFYTGKYMAIWEKRNGKWVCIRDIGNDDAEEN